MKIKKLGALLVLAALCAGMAAPAFAFEGEAAPVEQPVLPEVVEEDVVTVTDESSGALTPEGNLTLVDDYHTDYSCSGIVVIQCTTNHHRYQCISVAFLCNDRSYVSTVSHNTYPVSDRKNFFQFV